MYFSLSKGESACLYHTRSEWIPELRIAKFDLKKLEASLYRMQSIFRCLEPFRRDWQVWQTDRRTDGRTDCIIANAALHYICCEKRIRLPRSLRSFFWNEANHRALLRMTHCFYFSSRKVSFLVTFKLPRCLNTVWGRLRERMRRSWRHGCWACARHAVPRLMTSSRKRMLMENMKRHLWPSCWTVCRQKVLVVCSIVHQMLAVKLLGHTLHTILFATHKLQRTRGSTKSSKTRHENLHGHCRCYRSFSFILSFPWWIN